MINSHGENFLNISYSLLTYEKAKVRTQTNKDKKQYWKHNLFRITLQDFWQDFSQGKEIIRIGSTERCPSVV